MNGGRSMMKKRIGKRFRQRREDVGLTQEQLAEKVDISVSYLSMIERGTSFPRCEVLIKLINALNTSADAIFCDVINRTADYRASLLSEQLETLSPEERARVLDQVEYMIKREKGEIQTF